MRTLLARCKVALVLLILIPPTVNAHCPDGHYEVCVVFCGCVPNSGTVAEGASTVNPWTAAQQYVPPAFKSVEEAVVNTVEVVKSTVTQLADGVRGVGSGLIAGVDETVRNVERETVR